MSRFIAVGAALALVVTSVWTAPHALADWATTQRMETTAREPVIAELFTSEGCSSCPAADDVLTRLVGTQPIRGVEIIALGEHVDYWDGLGWRDPFSSAGLTKRQSQYGSNVFRTGSIYTPQLVIDGQYDTVGSDLAGIRTAALKAARQAKAQVSLAVTEAHGAPAVAVRATIPAQIVLRERADVLLAVTESGLVTSVRRGENGGRTLRHSAVVRDLTIIGAVSVGDRNLSITAPLSLSSEWKRENVELVVMIQEPQSRRIVGAGAVALTATTGVRQ